MLTPVEMSNFLAYRTLAPLDPDVLLPSDGPTLVSSSEDLIASLQAIISEVSREEPIAVLLSGGIDSAVLAALTSRSTLAVTIKFDAVTDSGEHLVASDYCRFLGLDHEVVTVSWNDYEQNFDHLAEIRNGPLHAIEVPLYVASQMIVSRGISKILVGNGADSNFGGLDKLLSRDYTVSEFVSRYCFADPNVLLKEPFDVSDVVRAFELPSGLVDVPSFLRTVHGRAIDSTFENAISAAGASSIRPFETLAPAEGLDLEMIRGGFPKKMVYDAFELLFPGFGRRKKVPFHRPMDDWIGGDYVPSHAAFKTDLNLKSCPGEVRYLVWALDRYLNTLGQDD